MYAKVKMVILGLRWGRGYDPILKLQGVLLPLSIDPLLPLARSPPTPLSPTLAPPSCPTPSPQDLHEKGALKTHLWTFAAPVTW